ncbi:MAG: tetratricopeptide repeat protein [Acidobacteriota bacterium]|nr:tetratricopeptide repeat protein [Acidobacteriota bacterium]
MTRRTIAVALLTLAIATAAQASWYDDYDAGLAAARKGNWSVAAQKMTAAIKGNPKEGNSVRTYGVITINYHPYYYRGVAYLQTGRYDEAIADFERTSGPGPENLGSLDTLMDRAKRAQAAANEPAPEPARNEPAPTPARPAPAVTQPAPATPAIPQIDPAMRQRASAALTGAKQKLQAAQQRRASGSPQYTQAMSIFTDATTRNANARSNDDLAAIINMADNAGDLADLALPPNAPAPAIATTTPPALTPSPIVPKPAAAASAVIDEDAGEVRRALEFYFAGEFEEATRRFQALTRKMPNNAWIHAFLGASQYSQYAFEADETYRAAAMKSFKRAKQLRSWKDGLPEKYFSKRIRKVFRDIAG